MTEERNLAGDRKTEQRGDRRGRRGKRSYWGGGGGETHGDDSCPGRQAGRGRRSRP